MQAISEPRIAKVRQKVLRLSHQTGEHLLDLLAAEQQQFQELDETRDGGMAPEPPQGSKPQTWRSHRAGCPWGSRLIILGHNFACDKTGELWDTGGL